ncbi:MAG: DUF4886 domain-containing protein, partial [Verrucomicrobiota bacterium]
MPSVKPSLRLAIVAVALLVSAFTLNAAERDTLKLLAIGNSFSRDCTAYLDDLAKAGGKTLVFGHAMIGGSSLEVHATHLAQAEAGDEAGRVYKNVVDPVTRQKSDATLPEMLKSTDWDFVTLQQWSRLSFKPETYQPYADQLIAAIRQYAPDAEILVHQTWAYREDHDFFQKNNGFTPQKMYDGLTAAYRAFADGKGFRILPSGDALQHARRTPRWTYVQDPDFDFKNPAPGTEPDQHASLNIGWGWIRNQTVFRNDPIHLNTAGKYLGACVWYLTLYETDTLPTDFLPKDLDAET